MNNSKEFYLSEPIHPVIQGEGLNIGKKMILIRLHLCDIQCPGCDSYHTWDNTRISKHKRRITVDSLIEQVAQISNLLSINHIMFTGGEPHLQQEQILEFVTRTLYTFDIETTGAKEWSLLYPYSHRIYFDLSPKIGSLYPGRNIGSYQFFEKKNSDKFSYTIKVVTSRENWDKDYDQIKLFQQRYNVPDEKIILMPMGTTREQILVETPFLVDKAFENRFQFSPRLHILMFNNQRLV